MNTTYSPGLNDWKLMSPVGDGESGAFWAEGPNRCSGVAKPAYLAGHPTLPMGAHEILASALAELIGVNVPRVEPWCDHSSGKLYTISYAPPDQTVTYRVAKMAIPGFSLRPVAAEIAQLFVFHCWINDCDHGGHDGNLLVSSKVGQHDFHVSSIDHARAFTFNRVTFDGPCTAINPHYLDRLELPNVVVAETIAMLQSVEPNVVADVVNRLDDAYITLTDRRYIIDRLLERRRSMNHL